MRIAMIGQKGMPTLWGGIERHVEELSVRLAHEGHAVFAFARKWYTNPNSKPKAQSSKFHGVHIIYAPTIHTKHFDAIIHSVSSTIKAMRMGMDVIHYHGVGPSLVAWIPKIFAPNIRIVSTFHCIDRKHKKWGLFARLALRLGEWSACKFADQTITVSDALHQYCDEAYDTETVHIPNGVNIVNVKKFPALKKFGLKSGTYVGFFSRLVPHKNAHLLISAWKNLNTKNPKILRGLKLAIVGDSSFTDKYAAELREMAKGDKSIVMTGYQSGGILNQLFAGAKMIVHPSESEGMSIAVLEAMSYGKTVLAADIPENKEALGSCGFYCHRNSLADLERKLSYLIQKPEILQNMGARAKRRVAENFNWEKIAGQVEKIYESNTQKLLATAKA